MQRPFSIWAQLWRHEGGVDRPGCRWPWWRHWSKAKLVPNAARVLLSNRYSVCVPKQWRVWIFGIAATLWRVCLRKGSVDLDNNVAKLARAKFRQFECSERLRVSNLMDPSFAHFSSSQVWNLRKLQIFVRVQLTVSSWTCTFKIFTVQHVWNFTLLVRSCPLTRLACSSLFWMVTSI